MVHNKLTVVAIYGHNDGSAAIPSLVHSVAQLEGSRGLLISREKPASLPAHIEWKMVCPLNYAQYSVFVMHSLYSYIDTEYCLIVQEDSWVLDGNNLKEEHYQYDYIGAPCHAAITGSSVVFGYEWVNEPDRIIIQNGGFSFRSKKLLEALNKNGLIHQPTADLRIWNEDVQITGFYRGALEGLGIRFAPDDVSKRFAIEYMVPQIHLDVLFDDLVGSHGQSRKMISDNHVVADITLPQIKYSYREQEFLLYLQVVGYRVDYVEGNAEEGTIEAGKSISV